MDKIERLYNLKVIKSNNRLEVYKYQMPQREGIKGHNNNGRKGSSGNGSLNKEAKEVNRKKVLYRARNEIIRLIFCNPMSTFITLTYKDVPDDLKQSKLDLRNFFIRLNKVYKGIKYLYVLEFGSLKGRLHYHVLCDISLPNDINFAKSREKKSNQHKIYENEFNNKFWQKGFIDIRDLNKEGISNISKYVASYLAEDLINLNLKGHRCYGYSQTLEKPIVEKLETKDNILDLIELSQYDLKFISQYQINYKNKKNELIESDVHYFDYIKKD